jgi:hypothetical protein
LTAAEESIHQRSAGVTSTGVDGHAGRFVNGDYVVVFVEDVERNGFGFGAQGRATLNLYSDALAAPDAMRAFRGASIYEDQVLVDEFLRARAAKVESICNVLVQTLPGFALADEEFVKRRFVALGHEEIVAAVLAMPVWMPTDFVDSEGERLGH